jgi:hypothetical protein
MVLCCNTANSFSLSDISDLSQVVIAIANLFLAGYVLFYQIRKDKKTDNETAKLNEQNIKLQWFKELIVQPNMDTIALFYSNLHTIKDKINSNELTIEEKEDINNFVKAELAKLRKSFVDVLQLVDKKFSDQLLQNLDALVDGITNAIFDDELKLKKPSVYEKNIGSKISYSKNNLISQLYNYKGISH